MKRYQFTLCTVFVIVFLAAFIAWASRLDIDFGLILTGALVGAIVPRRSIASLLGGIVGAIAVCLLIYGPPLWRHYPGTGMSYPPWRAAKWWLDHSLRLSVFVGTFIGVVIGSIKEIRKWHRARNAVRFGQADAG